MFWAQLRLSLLSTPPASRRSHIYKNNELMEQAIVSQKQSVLQSVTRSFQTECVRRKSHPVEVALVRSFGGRRLLVAKLKQPLRISGGRRRTGARTPLVGKNCVHICHLSIFHRLGCQAQYLGRRQLEKLSCS